MRKNLLMLTIVLLSISALWSTEVKITASDADVTDYFGYSVSISGDYVIVGAHQEDAGGSEAGAAYIFIRNGANWTEQTKLTASDAGASDRFGYSVSISGNYAVVGAYYEDTGGLGVGAAYIFHRDGVTWTQQQKLTTLDAEVNDRFGWSVSIYGDYVVIGTYGKNSAYVFHRSDETWTQQVKLTADDAGAAGFGHSISISGDYVIVGAERTDYNDPGAAYIFHRSAEIWTKQAKLVASDRQNGDYFGNSVSISGDYAIVGAFYEDDSGNDAGAAYIFHRSVETWTQQQKITASNAESGDYFGQSVSISGNYAIIGAYREDTGGTDAGAAYSYLRSGSNWLEKSLITASDVGENEYFGNSVSISGDFTIIGKYYDNNAAGAAYIYVTTSDLSLPVELIDFTVEQKNSCITLQWITESEIENLGFILERQNGGKFNEWNEIASYIDQPDLQGQGSITARTEYYYTDNNIIPGMTYVYRLSDVSYSGEVVKHKICQITVKKENYTTIPETFVLKNAYPNPFNPITTIAYHIAEPSFVRLSIYDVKGRLIETLVNDNKITGSYAVKWNAGKLGSGIYIYRIDAGSFSQVKKCLVVK